MSKRVNDFRETALALKKAREALVAKEEAAIKEGYQKSVSFDKSLEHMRSKRETKRHYHGVVKEQAKNTILGDILKGIYIGALEASTLTDEALLLAESMVDNWIEENGGASAIFAKNRGKTYLIDHIISVVEAEADKEVKEIEDDVEDIKDDLEEEEKDKDDKDKESDSDDKSDDKDDDVDDKYDDSDDDDKDDKSDDKDDDKDDSVDDDKSDETKSEEEAPEEPAGEESDTTLEEDDFTDDNNEETPDTTEDDTESEAEKESEEDTEASDNGDGGEVDDSVEAPEDADSLGDPSNLDDEIEDDEEETTEEIEVDDDTGEETVDIDKVSDVPEEDNGTAGLEDSEEVEASDKEFLDDLDKEEDVQKAVELIRTRVANAEEDFIKQNAEDKKKMDDILGKISDNVKTVEAITKDDEDKTKEDEIKEAVAMTHIREGKRKMQQITNNRPLSVFEKFTRNLTNGIIRENSVKTNYIDENGAIETEYVVESAKVMYAWLETINTLQLEKVDAAYIQNILDNM